MADQKISELNELTEPLSGDTLPIVNNGETKKITIGNLLSGNGYVQSGNTIFLQPDLNDNRNIEIYNTSPSDIHIKGNSSYSFFGDDTNYVKIDNSLEKITINTNSGTTINGLFKLSPVSELPTSSTLGDMVVSGSNLYFHNGTSWNSVNMTSI